MLPCSVFIGEGPLVFSIWLLADENDDPPKYNNSPSSTSQPKLYSHKVKRSIYLETDLRKIAKEAFERGTGPRGEYYQVELAVEVVFSGPTQTEFHLLHEDEVLETVAQIDKGPQN